MKPRSCLFSDRPLATLLWLRARLVPSPTGALEDHPYVPSASVVKGTVAALCGLVRGSRRAGRARAGRLAAGAVAADESRNCSWPKRPRPFASRRFNSSRDSARRRNPTSPRCSNTRMIPIQTSAPPSSPSSSSRRRPRKMRTPFGRCSMTRAAMCVRRPRSASARRAKPRARIARRWSMRSRPRAVRSSRRRRCARSRRSAD